MMQSGSLYSKWHTWLIKLYFVMIVYSWKILGKCLYEVLKIVISYV